MNFIKIILFIFILFFSLNTFGNNLDLTLNENIESDISNSPFELKGTFQYMINHINHYQDENGIFTTQGLTSSHYHFSLTSIFDNGLFKAEMQIKTKIVQSNDNPSISFKYLWGTSSRNRIIPHLYTDADKNLYFINYFNKAYFKYSKNQFNISVGRQIISWGEGRFLNPLNLISPTSPFSQDISDISGSDLLYSQFFIAENNFIEVVVHPHQRANKKKLSYLKTKDINFLLRNKNTFNFIDITFILGYHYHSYILGFESNTSILDASIRFSYLARKENQENEVQDIYGFKNRWSQQMIFGISYAFFKSKLKTNFELFYNSNHYEDNNALKNLIDFEKLIAAQILSPLNNDASYFVTQGRILTKNELMLQLSLEYNIAHNLKVNLFQIYDVLGSSLYITPQIIYDVDLNIDFTLGMVFYLLPEDKSKAEFSGGEISVYGYIDFYF